MIFMMNSSNRSRVSEHTHTKQRSISQPSQRPRPDLRAYQQPLAVWPVSGGCFTWEETTEKGTTAERTLRSQLSTLVLLLKRLALMRWLPRDLLDRSRDELHWCWPAIKRHFKGKMWRVMYSVCSMFSNTYQMSTIGLEVKARMVLRYMDGVCAP